jgi:rubrerythrin
MLDTNLTMLEIYGIAIKSEIDAAQAYQQMSARVKNQDLKKKLLFLKSEEVKHRRLLTAQYRTQFPKIKLILPKQGLAPKLSTALAKNTTIEKLFELALDAEYASETFYAEAANRAQDQTGKNLLRYLSGMERGHYYTLKAEYDLMQQSTKFESYKKFSQEHLGP